MIPIFKKGDPNKCANYRGIALMSVCAKLYNRMILIRLRNGLLVHLRPNQNGYLPMRSTAQHVLCLRRIFEEIESIQGGHAVSIFIDFSKAFDSVDWNYIENILYAYCVPEEIANAIMSVYYGAKATVRFNNELSDYFKLGVGVLQGDTLAPFLFILVIDWIMRNAVPDDSIGLQLKKPPSRRYLGKYITDLDYCDDIALLSGTWKGAQNLLLSTELWAKKVGLNINVAKTEFLLIGSWNPSDREPNFYLSGNKSINEVNDFKYLGTWLRSTSKDLTIRKAQAWEAARRLYRLWKCKILTQSTKLNLFKSLIEPILIYNATTWTLNKTITKKLNGIHMSLLRYALNINWKDHIKNIDLFKSLKLEPISIQLQRRRLTFVGHCWRSLERKDQAPNPITDLLFWEIEDSKRKCGGQRSNYRKLLIKESKCTKEELYELMLDRNSWKIQINKIIKKTQVITINLLKSPQKNQQISTLSLTLLLLVPKKLLFLPQLKPQQRKKPNQEK